MIRTLTACAAMLAVAGGAMAQEPDDVPLKKFDQADIQNAAQSLGFAVTETGFDKAGAPFAVMEGSMDFTAVGQKCTGKGEQQACRQIMFTQEFDIPDGFDAGEFVKDFAKDIAPARVFVRGGKLVNQLDLAIDGKATPVSLRVAMDELEGMHLMIEEELDSH